MGNVAIACGVWVHEVIMAACNLVYVIFNGAK